MKLQVSIALALLSGAAMAMDRDDGRDRDGHEHWRHDYDRRVVEHAPVRWDRDHRRYWDGGRWVVDTAIVAAPRVAVCAPFEVSSLNVAIGALDIQIADLRRGPWFHGRDERIRELCVRRDRDRERERGR